MPSLYTTSTNYTASSTVTNSLYAYATSGTIITGTVQTSYMPGLYQGSTSPQPTGASSLINLFDNNGNVNFYLDPQTNNTTIYANAMATTSATVDLFIGDGVTKNFTLSKNPISMTYMTVNVGGVGQEPYLSWSLSGTNVLSFIQAPPYSTITNIMCTYFSSIPLFSYTGAQGTIGAQGLGGTQGTVGTQGLQGPRNGAQGVGGPQGVQGLMGVAGGGIGYYGGQQQVIVAGAGTTTTNAGTGSIAIGYYSGINYQGLGSVAVGEYTGNINQGISAVAIGSHGPGSITLPNTSSTNVISGPVGAGYDTQGDGAIAIGVAGVDHQNPYGIAIGYGAGYTTQPQNAINIGQYSGRFGYYSTGSTDQISIGTKSGFIYQQSNAIAVGNNAGFYQQGTGAIAFGLNAGNQSQVSFGIAIGAQAGNQYQGTSVTAPNGNGYPVALGYYAGNYYQADGAIAIGNEAGHWYQGSNSIAIGAFAGQGYTGTAPNYGKQGDNTIIINATGLPLNSTGSGAPDYATTGTFQVKPVRHVTNGSLPSGFYNMAYNPTTGEIIYWT